MFMEHGIYLVVLLVFVWSSATWDVLYLRIPNFLVLASSIVGVLLSLWVSGAAGIFNAVFGLVLGFLLFFPGYLAGTTGAGDVKLMAAIGAYLGPYDVILAALTSIAVGGLVALGYAASSLFNLTSISPWSRYGLMFKTLVTTGRPIYIAPAEGEVMGRKFPFAVSIAIGTTLFLAWDSQLLTLAGLAK